MRRILFILALLLVSDFLPAQIIWYEDFDLPNGTTVDNGSTAWSIDLTYDCGGSLTGYFRVESGQLDGYDTDCQALWTS